MGKDCPQPEQAWQAISLRLKRTQTPLTLPLLFARCGLDPFQQSCVILAYSVLLDRKYEKLFAYLQDDLSGKVPRVELAVQLFLPEGESVEECLCRFFRKNGFTRLFRPDRLSEGSLVLRETVVEFLASGTVSSRSGRTLFDGGVRAPDGPLAVQNELAHQLDLLFSSGEARRSCCILFFDECDTLFGKRGEVKDSNDRSTNMEVAYLLQQIEEYDGVCVLATNLLGNVDEAFIMRRMTYVIRFPVPDASMRAELYRRTIPADAPKSDDIDWDFLARKFELSGAFMAAGEGTPISMRHLLRSAVDEMKKNGIVVVREELREYADLLEEG